MRKKIFIVLVAFLMVTIVGCGKKETPKKESILKVELKDNIKATAKIEKNIDKDVVRIKLNRKKEGDSVSVKLIYYYNKKEVYNENTKYIFPSKDIDCLLDMAIKTETLKLKKGANLNSYTDADIERTKLDYDSLELIISK